MHPSYFTNNFFEVSLTFTSTSQIVRHLLILRMPHFLPPTRLGFSYKEIPAQNTHVSCPFLCLDITQPANSSQLLWHLRSTRLCLLRCGTQSWTNAMEKTHVPNLCLETCTHWHALTPGQKSLICPPASVPEAIVTSVPSRLAAPKMMTQHH